MQTEGKKPIQVTIGEKAVTLKRPGRSALVLANILGTRGDARGEPEVLWLDRVVHAPDDLFEGWSAGGAISTVLVRAT